MCPNESELVRLVGGEVPADRRERLVGHLQSCPSCRRTFDEIQATWELLGELQVQPTGADFTSRVLAAAARRPAPLPWLRIAAAIVVAAGAGWIAGRAMPLPGPAPLAAATSQVSDEQLAVSLGLDALVDRPDVLAQLFLQPPDDEQEQPL
jgi:anti-sigma factor RsiW